MNRKFIRASTKGQRDTKSPEQSFSTHFIMFLH